MQLAPRLTRLLYAGCWLIALLCFVATPSYGQSTDISAPTPVSSNDLVGSIAARDLGDSRLTLHFYAFSGTPGDVLITVKSNNLNGDVDVFTAGSLRPLLKFTLYAGSASPATKGIYLRRREDLVLRVEARSPSDDEGSYQIRFGGSFEASAARLVAEADTKERLGEPLARSGKKGRRVSSVGARINEPQPPPEEVAAIPPAEETPSPTATPEKAVEAEAPKTTPPRRGRARGAAGRRTPPPAAKEETAATETKEPIPVENKEEAKAAGAVQPETQPATLTRRAGRRGAKAAATPPVEPEPPTGPRLILELLDGTRIERFMSTVRRVTIENNQIVVVRKDGKIERTRMTEVVRMSIEP